LTSTEKQGYIQAVQCLQQRPAGITGKAGVKTRFDEFQATHIDLTDEVHQVVGFVGSALSVGYRSPGRI
jgi:tyrosinase